MYVTDGWGGHGPCAYVIRVGPCAGISRFTFTVIDDESSASFLTKSASTVAGFNTEDLVKQCAQIVRIHVGQCVARDRTHLRVNIVYQV